VYTALCHSYPYHCPNHPTLRFTAPPRQHRHCHIIMADAGNVQHYRMGCIPWLTPCAAAALLLPDVVCGLLCGDILSSWLPAVVNTCTAGIGDAWTTLVVVRQRGGPLPLCFSYLRRALRRRTAPTATTYHRPYPPMDALVRATGRRGLCPGVRAYAAASQHINSAAC